MKIRIKFTKEGALKFIGHLDIMRYFQKVMRRAGVDIRYSEGFSPHQIMSFAAPLGVGMESRGEYVDIEVLSTDPSEVMLKRINAAMAEGMEALSYRRLPDDAVNAMSVVAAADYQVRFREGCLPEEWTDFASGIQDFLSQKEIRMLKKTKKGEREIDIRPMIYEMQAGTQAEDGGQEIFLKIAAGSAANLKPEAVIRSYTEYRGRTLPDFSLLITRMEVYADQGGEDGHRFLPLEAFGEDIEQ